MKPLTSVLQVKIVNILLDSHSQHEQHGDGEELRNTNLL